VVRALRFVGGEVYEGGPRPTRRLTEADLAEMELRSWGGLAHIAAGKIPGVLEDILLALDLPPLEQAQREFGIRVGQKFYRAYLAPDRRGRFVCHIPELARALVRKGETKRPRVWTLAELYCLHVTGENRILKRGSLTWWLLLLWRAGQIPAPPGGFHLRCVGYTPHVVEVEKAWVLLWYLRNLAWPGEPVKFSARFAQSLCGGSVRENIDAIHTLRLKGVMHFAETKSADPFVDARNGFAYVDGAGQPDPSFRPFMVSPYAARRHIATVVQMERDVDALELPEPYQSMFLRVYWTAVDCMRGDPSYATERFMCEVRQRLRAVPTLAMLEICPAERERAKALREYIDDGIA
jgi:hypothetical protein